MFTSLGFGVVIIQKWRLMYHEQITQKVI